MSEEYEEVEVVDFKAVGIIAVIIALVGVGVGVFAFGIIEFPEIPITDEPLDEIIQRNQEDREMVEPQSDPTRFENGTIIPIIEPEPKQKPKQIPEQVFEIITNPFDHRQDTPVETLTLNERLMKEFLSFGLQEEDIAYILTDDCIKYGNSTNLDERYKDIQFEKLVQVKTELCAWWLIGGLIV